MHSDDIHNTHINLCDKKQMTQKLPSLQALRRIAPNAMTPYTIEQRQTRNTGINTRL
jgi:hypothetical protein